jgi:UDP-N-acetylglucosamine acyltransferase
MQRRGFTSEVVNEVLEIYRNLYNKGLNITQALEYIDQKLPASAEKTSIVTFIKGSKKGIVKSSNKVEADED